MEIAFAYHVSERVAVLGFARAEIQQGEVAQLERRDQGIRQPAEVGDGGVGLGRHGADAAGGVDGEVAQRSRGRGNQVPQIEEHG